MAARAHFSHNELQDKNSSEMQEMLFQKGINWNDFPAFFRRGSYVRRVVTTRKFTTEELEALPPKHNARLNPELEVERSEIKVLELPPLGRIANREGVLFLGEAPVLKAEI
jgi:hypothetical protein